MGMVHILLAALNLLLEEVHIYSYFLFWW